MIASPSFDHPAEYIPIVARVCFFRTESDSVGRVESMKNHQSEGGKRGRNWEEKFFLAIDKRGDLWYNREGESLSDTEISVRSFFE